MGYAIVVLAKNIYSFPTSFPTIKQEIKAFLNGETTSGEFQGHLRDMLGLA